MLQRTSRTTGFVSGIFLILITALMPYSADCQVLFSSDGSDLSLFPCFYLTWIGPDPVIDESVGQPAPSIGFTTGSPANYAMSAPYVLPTLDPGFVFRASQDFRLDGESNYICVACYGISTQAACDYQQYGGPFDGRYPFPVVAYDGLSEILTGYFTNSTGNLGSFQVPFVIETGVWHQSFFEMTQVSEGVFAWSLFIDGLEAVSGESHGEVRDNDSLGVIIGAAGSYRATDARVDNVVVELDRLCDYGPVESLEFERKRGKPITETVVWESCGGPGVLLVEADGVSSAYVLVNDAIVLSPNDFSPKIEMIEVPIVLVEGPNTIEVELRGKPGSSVTMEFLSAE